jgi:hypothetical protein
MPALYDGGRGMVRCNPKTSNKPDFKGAGVYESDSELPERTKQCHILHLSTLRKIYSTGMQKHELQLSENKVLRKMFLLERNNMKNSGYYVVGTLWHLVLLGERSVSRYDG